MKLTFYILFILTIKISSQNFFPLSYGDKYQLKYNISSLTLYKKYYVLKDTLIDTKVFYGFNYVYNNLDKPYPIDSYFYYDSLEQKIFIKLASDDTIKLAVDFNVPKDSSFISYITGQPRTFTSFGKYKDLIFGDSIIIYKMFGTWAPAYIYRYEYIFAEGIGLYYFNGRSGNYHTINDFKSTVISCIIGQNIINPITLHISNLSPLFDRPINTFPFLLNGTYVTQFNLVDSFFVEIKHERNNEIINEYKVNFNYSGNASIVNNNFQPGDKLHLRGIAKDSSIYSNIAFYPDTGYATINILNTTNIFDEINSYNFSLSQNYPNPFNPSTIINFQLENNSYVELKVYDVLGKEVAVLVNNYLEQGNHTIEFITEEYQLNSSVYFYKLTDGINIAIKKMLLIK